MKDYIIYKTNNKINLDKYLLTKVKYSNNDYNTVFKYISEILLNWIETNENLDRFIDDETYYKHFNLFIYSEYLTPHTKYNYKFDDKLIDYFEHFSSTNNDEIISMYFNFKEIFKSMNISLFNNNKDCSYPFNEFIFSICDYKDPYNGDIDEHNSLDNEEDIY
jgi:hypothetical protein